jgi:hypothetical protein
MPDCPDWVLPLVLGLGSLALLFFIMFVFAAADASAKDRQLAELRRLLEHREAQLQWMSARLRMLAEQAEGLLGAQEQSRGKLRLDQQGNLREEQNGRGV